MEADKLVILLVMGMMYMAPTIIAFWRKHVNTMAICTMNLLLGWTVLGWIFALVWSMTADTKKQAA